MKRLMSKETDSGNTLITFKDYFDNKYAIVSYREGMPYRIVCNTDDCGHVGFAICLKEITPRISLGFIKK